MKLYLSSSPATPHSYTIQHLMGWVESLDILADTKDWPFETLDELAMQLEVWRDEFQTVNSGKESSEPVLVSLYGEEIILVCNQETGEFFTLSPIATCIQTISIS